MTSIGSYLSLPKELFEISSSSVASTGKTVVQLTTWNKYKIFIESWMFLLFSLWILRYYFNL